MLSVAQNYGREQERQSAPSVLTELSFETRHPRDPTKTGVTVYRARVAHGSREITMHGSSYVRRPVPAGSVSHFPSSRLAFGHAFNMKQPIRVVASGKGAVVARLSSDRLGKKPVLLSRYLLSSRKPNCACIARILASS